MMRSGRAGMCAVLVVGLAVVSAPTAATAKSFTVKPGQSIQAAVDGASPGDTIKVMPGDYTETNAGPAALRITKSLKLIAKSKLPSVKVRLLPNAGQPGQMHGILVEPANEGDPDISGFTIQGFTVEGFPHNGIWLRHVNKFTIQGNESINNLENGIFPTLSANGLVKKNVAYGSTDSAMWVEASQNVRVLNNDLSKSPTGFELTISNEITVQQNNIHDNTIGVGAFHPATAGLPQNEWPSFEFGNWHILKNSVHDNNMPTTAPEETESSQLPYGGGILLLGVDHVDVQKNQIENNDFFGVGIIDYCLAVAATSFDCSAKPPPVADTAPGNNQIIKNTLVNNHGAPPPGPFQAIASDIVEIGGEANGTNNCFSKNTISNTPPLLPVTIPDPLAPVCK